MEEHMHCILSERKILPCSPQKITNQRTSLAKESHIAGKEMARRILLVGAAWPVTWTPTSLFYLALPPARARISTPSKSDWMACRSFVDERRQQVGCMHSAAD
jgi:hypothetical protein